MFALLHGTKWKMISLTSRRKDIDPGGYIRVSLFIHLDVACGGHVLRIAAEVFGLGVLIYPDVIDQHVYRPELL
jgi:hypothetical protein